MHPCNEISITPFSGITAKHQARGQREGGRGESLRVGEEAHPDHQRSGAPKGRLQPFNTQPCSAETLNSFYVYVDANVLKESMDLGACEHIFLK